MELFEWKRARLRSESNISLGVIILLMGLLARPVAKAAVALLDSQAALTVIGLVGVGILVGVAQWRKRGAYSVYGLNMLGTVLTVYSLAGLLSPDKTEEIFATLPEQRSAMIGLGILLLVMGIGLRRMYLRRESEQAERKAVEQGAGEQSSDALKTGPDAPVS